jgi:kinesin family protein 11
VESVSSTGKESNKTFHFDGAVGPETSQSAFYHMAAAPVVAQALDGYNCTIFAYGQTGTGKTFTMEGPPGTISPGAAGIDLEAMGIIPRAVKDVFDQLHARQVAHTVRVSHMEVYNEELMDLMAATSTGGTPPPPTRGKLPSDPSQAKLRLFEDQRPLSAARDAAADAGVKAVRVVGLEEFVVSGWEEVLDLLARSSQRRTTGETLLNKNSSRSHCIFTLTITTKETSDDGEDLVRVGRLNLVDLAGSENLDRSGVEGRAQRESRTINQSLLTLGRVINALVEGRPHVPYRESKLTRLLQESLGGRAKTLLIATVSPSALNVVESLSTLDYAHRAKHIKNRPEVNQRMTAKKVMAHYAGQIERLQQQLQAAREKNGVFLPETQLADMEADLKERAERIEGLELAITDLRAEVDEAAGLLGVAQDDVRRAEAEAAQQAELVRQEAAAKERARKEAAATQRKLAQERAVAVERSKQQHALRSNVDDLISRLSSTTDDFSAVYDRLQKGHSRDAANTAGLTSMQRRITREAQAAQTEAANLHAGMSSLVRSLTDAVSVRTGEMDSALVSLRSQVSAFAASTDSALTNAAQCAAKDLQRLASLAQTTLQSDQGQAAAAASFAAEAASLAAALSSELGSALSAQAQAHRDLAGTLSSSFEAMEATVAELVAAHDALSAHIADGVLAPMEEVAAGVRSQLDALAVVEQRDAEEEEVTEQVIVAAVRAALAERRAVRAQVVYSEGTHPVRAAMAETLGVVEAIPSSVDAAHQSLLRQLDILRADAGRTSHGARRELASATEQAETVLSRAVQRLGGHSAAVSACSSSVTSSCSRIGTPETAEAIKSSASAAERAIDAALAALRTESLVAFSDATFTSIDALSTKAGLLHPELESEAATRGATVAEPAARLDAAIAAVAEIGTGLLSRYQPALTRTPSAKPTPPRASELDPAELRRKMAPSPVSRDSILSAYTARFGSPSVFPPEVLASPLTIRASGRGSVVPSPALRTRSALEGTPPNALGRILQQAAREVAGAATASPLSSQAYGGSATSTPPLDLNRRLAAEFD